MTVGCDPEGTIFCPNRLVTRRGKWPPSWHEDAYTVVRGC